MPIGPAGVSMEASTEPMAATAIGRFAWLMGVRPRMVNRQYVATTPRPMT